MLIECLKTNFWPNQSRKKTEKDSESHRLAIELRQNEAAKRREEIQRSKAEKVRKIAEKVESVQKNKNSVQMEKQKKLDQKMRRAELNKETKKTNFKVQGWRNFFWRKFWLFFPKI